MRISRSLLVSALLAQLVVPTVSEAQTAGRFYARERLGLGSGNSVDRTTNPGTEVPPTSPEPEKAKWSVGTWSNWSSTCSQEATRTRSVVCQQGSSPVDDAKCTASKPQASEVQAVYEGCTDILLNPSMDTNLDFWTISGDSTYNGSVGNGWVEIPVGGSISQTGRVSTVAGQAYTLTIGAEARGGTAYKAVYDVVISQGGIVSASGNYQNARTSYINFVGTGMPVHVMITSAGSRAVRYKDIRISPQ